MDNPAFLMNLSLLHLLLYQTFLHRELHLQVLLQYEITPNRELVHQENVEPIRKKEMSQRRMGEWQQ